MFTVHRNKIIGTLLLLITAGTCLAQENRLQQYENYRIRFGFSLFMTHCNFQVNTSPDFLKIDSLQQIRVTPFLGFGLGAVTDFKLSKYMSLRVLPSLSFAQRNVQYSFTKASYNKLVEIESAYIDLPILLKYKSERKRNLRFYLIGGVKMSYDLASNFDAPRSLTDPVVALKPVTWNWEIGAGMDIFFPFFKWSPEIKYTQSFANVLVRDEYVYTTALSSLYSRMVTVSFHFE